MTKELKMSVVKDLTTVPYNGIDKEFGCFCVTQHFKIIGGIMNDNIRGHQISKNFI